MAKETVQNFIKALGALEERRELEPMLRLFAPDAEFWNTATERTLRGREGARDYWTQYRGSFGTIRSTFNNIIVSGNGAALEWTSEGTTHEGSPVRYDGVTILEIEGDLIRRFHAYFDPESVGRRVVSGHA